jgi:hypothetical protein
MSDRTHQYRQLSRRDPATTAEMFARDADGNQVPLVTSADGKLIVEVSGGGGGTASEVVIKGTVPAVPAVPNPADPDGPPLEPAVPAYAVKVKSNPSGEISVVPKDDALVALRGLVPEVVEVPGVNPGDPPIVEGEDAYLTDLSATAEGDLNVLVRGLVPAVVEVPGALPGDPPIVAGVPEHLTALRATEDGELAVAITAPVSLMAREDGLSPAADVRLVATGDGALHVAIENSVTVPVEVQGVAEVKATSANWWAIGRGLGPVIVPDLSDSEGWIDVRPFSRISATGIGQTYTYDLADGFVLRSGTVHRVTSYAELTAAISDPGTVNGDTIFLMNGVYEVPFGATGAGTLTINKSLRLIGESRDGVIIQTPVQTSGTDALRVLQILTITASNVEIRNLTLYHRQTVISSAGSESCIFVADGVVGTLIDTCKILYMEFGVTVRGQFSIRSCDFEYATTAPVSNSTYRAIGIYGITADSEIVDVTAKFIATNTPRFIWLGAFAGTTYAGTLTIARCVQTGGYVHQWVEMPSLPGTPGAFDLVMADNVLQAFGAGIIFSASANSDVLNSVTLKGNQMANAPKGMLGFDGARTTPLLIFATGNTATDPTLAAAYDSIYEGFLVAARNTVSSQYVVVGSDEIPDLGIPEETGSSTLIYADTTVALEYRVTRDEPYTAEIAAHKLHTTHKHIVPPLEPQDILGVGFVRFNATDLHTNPGGSFAIFGVAK